MTCPNCGHKAVVTHSPYPSADGKVNYRRYECEKCTIVFQTRETFHAIVAHSAKAQTFRA
jgi:transcriptional regulator NrdR family protein